LIENFGSPGQVATIPEPASIAIAAAGLLVALAAAARHRRRAIAHRARVAL
jgi:MYXO-CTERM domain-containing protein